jgi:capsid protein
LPSGKDFRWLNWEFVPAGVPWWDPVKEVTGNRLAVASGFTSPQRVCREVGTDLETNIREIADARRIAHEAGIELDFGSVVAETLPVEKEEEA